MKKILALILALTMVLTFAACGKKDENTAETADSDKNSQTQTAQTDGSVPEGAVTDETKLGEAITYNVDGDNLIIKVKTSAEINAHKAAIDIVNAGIYLTRDSKLITQSIYGGGRCFAEEFDKEWFDGIYTFKLDNNMITGLASDESEWAPGTWTMMLYDEDTGVVIGQWLIVLEGGGKYHFAFNDSFLKGAGEDKKAEEFESKEKEIESWFTFKADESYDEWATFNFDGYYLEEIDPQGYDKYYLMVCPEGDYKTYDDADAVDLTYCGIGGVEYAKCPYRFSFEQHMLENGKYTMVLAKQGGKVEAQFGAEKVSAKEWKLDFTNAKSIYAVTAE